MEWPNWWKWRLEISSHCFKRMQERGFNETELRAMLHDAMSAVEQDHGTFVVVTSLENCRWEVIVAPDPKLREIVVVTAYPTPTP